MDCIYSKHSDIIEDIASRFRSKKFLYISEEDIEQEVRRICCEAMLSFDDTRGASIFTYLMRCVSNRINNFKRDNYFRYHNPCVENKCPAYDVFTNDCLYSEEYKRLCSDRKKYDKKMQRQIYAANYASVDDIDDRHTRMHDSGPDENMLIVEVREEIVRCSGEKFGEIFDNMMAGDKKCATKKQVEFIQTVTAQIMGLDDGQE